MRQNEYLWSKGLTLSQTRILNTSKLKEFGDNFKFYENGRKFS